MNRARSQSEKLPQQRTAVMVTREELCRQMQLHSDKKTSVKHLTMDNRLQTSEDYALPDKEKRSREKEIRRELKVEGQAETDSEVSVTVDGPFRISTRKSSCSSTTDRGSARCSGRDEESAITIDDFARGVAEPPAVATNSEGGCVDADIHLCREDKSGTIRGVLELSTFRQTRVPRIKVRLVCMVDMSGSMLIKGDSHRKRSKIGILKNMIADVIDALEDGEDSVGVMTFGEKPEVVCPLTKISASSRFQFKKRIDEMDRTQTFASQTNLSSAILQAVQILHEAQAGESLLYRNCIIIFSDGEANAGVTDPSTLVHKVREKIRECSMPQEFLSDLWVNVSCVTTGSNFSQSLYLLSKLCGSDAYFFVDGNKKSRPEADMLIPLMLRKKACAQMISVSVRAENGANLHTEKCSQEYSVRRKRVNSAEDSSMRYFLHDMPSGSQKTFQLELAGPSSLTEKDFLFVDVQYVDSLGVLHNVSKSVHLKDVPSANSDDPRSLVAMAKSGINTIRQLFQTTCRDVATILEDDAAADRETPMEEVIAMIHEGKRKLNVYRNEMALTRLSESQSQEEYAQFANAVEANLSRLQSMLKRSAMDRMKCWQYVKTVSSAIIRELPTVSDILTEPQVVCPIPKDHVWDSPRTHALSMYVFGQDPMSSSLHAAVSDVATTLAAILKSLEDKVDNSV